MQDSPNAEVPVSKPIPPYTPPPPTDCPDDPTAVCQWFVDKSALLWYVWSIHAHVRYDELGCPDSDKVRPPMPSLTGCGEADDCKDVCKRIDKWAKEMRKWALDFTKAMEDCLSWSAQNPVPVAPTGRCQTCDEACAAVRAFHTPLKAWGAEVTDRLNQGGGAPGLVPPPPPPP